MEKGYESGRQLPITGDNQILTPYQGQPMNPQQPIMYNMPPCQYQFVSDPLAELMYAQKASVKQRFELFEALSGCETKNQYYISTVENQGNKKYLFKVKESSSCCCRFFCSGANREFTLNLRKISYTPQGQEKKEDFATFFRPFKCTCCCCNRPELSGTFIGGRTGKVGKVSEPCTVCET